MKYNFKKVFNLNTLTIINKKAKELADEDEYARLTKNIVSQVYYQSGNLYYFLTEVELAKKNDVNVSRKEEINICVMGVELVEYKTKWELREKLGRKLGLKPSSVIIDRIEPEATGNKIRFDIRYRRTDSGLIDQEIIIIKHKDL